MSFFSQLRWPILHQRQRLRRAFTGGNGNEALTVASRSILATEAPRGQLEQMFAAADLELRTRAIDFDRRNPGEIEVIDFLPVRAPTCIRASAVRDLPL